MLSRADVKTLVKPFYARLYTVFTGEQPSSTATLFFKHLGWIGAGFFLSKGVTFLVTLSAGRLLGPVEFGKVNLVIDVGTLLYSFSLFGIGNSISKYGATLSDPSEFREMMSSAILVAGTGVLAISAVSLAAGPQIARLLSVPTAVFYYGWAYAASFTFYTVFTSIAHATHRIKERSFLEVTFAFSLALAFLFNYLLGNRTFRIHSGALVTGYMVAGIVSAVLMRSLWKMGFNLTWLKRHLHYGAYGLGQSLSFFCLANLQRLLLNGLVSTREAGIYSAYSVASISQAYYAANAVAILLLPRSSASTNRGALWKKACRGWAMIALPMLVAIALFEVVTLLIMGHHKFGLDGEHVAVFALAALAVMVYNTLSSILAAEGTRGAAFILCVSIGIGLANLLLGILWIPMGASTGAAAAIGTAYALGLLWFWAGHKRYV